VANLVDVFRLQKPASALAFATFAAVPQLLSFTGLAKQVVNNDRNRD
jgi:hypothetical protein